METPQATLDWLLEEDNPGVRLRALTELCELPEDHEAVSAAREAAIRSLPAAQDLSWVALKGQVVVYSLTSLAESGLAREDVAIERAVDALLSERFDANCGEMMALRALVMLGYGGDPRVEERLARLTEAQLPDGAWLCLHRLRKARSLPKSCIRAGMHGLLLAGEMAKRGLTFGAGEALAGYFLRRRLFYRTDNPTQLVLQDHPGRRMTDIFFPAEYFRVGLPVLLDALAALGVAHDPALQDAWCLLDAKRDTQGRVPLEGTLPAKSLYLPRERVGKPSKWGTLYACLAYERRARLCSPQGEAGP